MVENPEHEQTLALSHLSMIRVCAITPTLRVADVEFNTAEILKAVNHAYDEGARIILFPELCISGYSCGDLFFQPTLLNAVEKSIVEIVEATSEMECAIIVGAPLRNKGQLYNCAVVISNGDVEGVVPKTFLPNYNEFYEQRWFASSRDNSSDTIIIDPLEVAFGNTFLIETLGPVGECKIGIEICEDLWAVESPSFKMALEGAHIICNLSASNELVGKANYRRSLVLQQSARCQGAYIYASAGAGESSTDVVFAGHNLIAENGTLLAESDRFSFDTTYCFADIDIERINNERLRNSTFRAEKSEEEFEIEFAVVADTQASTLLRPNPAHPFLPLPNEQSERFEEVIAIQSTGLAKRLRHTQCSKVILGLSGGLDSTHALLVCWETFARLGIDRKNIVALSLPCFGTSDRTRNNAQALADEFDITFQEIDITETVRSHFRDIGHDEHEHSILFENAQARERTQVLMDIANQRGALVVGTGDLSELALGWCTYNGDHMSMYALNSGVPKTLIRSLVEWYMNTRSTPQQAHVLRDILATPISPELIPSSDSSSPVQDTEKTIGPYELHDYFLFQFSRYQFSPQKIVQLAVFAFAGRYSIVEIRSWMKVFLTRFFANQFKRSAIPDGPKVGSVALSPRGDWRMPSDAVVQLWLDSTDEEFSTEEDE